MHLPFLNIYSSRNVEIGRVTFCWYVTMDVPDLLD